jgi:hypothetical protein
MEQDLWPDEERVTSQENAERIRPFEEDEIKIALFQIEKQSSRPRWLPYRVLPGMVAFHKGRYDGYI